MGAATASSASVPTTRVNSGRVSTRRNQPFGFSVRSASCARRSAIFCGVSVEAHSFFGMILVPAKDSTAGVRVTAIRAATTTQNAAALPITPRKGIPVTFSATSAIITVVAAKITALPLVPFARTIAWFFDMPSSRFVR